MIKKIQIFAKNRNFRQKSKFWSKIEILIKKIQIFAKHPNFWQNPNFSQKLKYWSRKSKFSPENEILIKNHVCCFHNFGRHLVIIVFFYFIKNNRLFFYEKNRLNFEWENLWFHYGLAKKIPPKTVKIKNEHTDFEHFFEMILKTWLYKPFYFQYIFWNKIIL